MREKRRKRKKKLGKSTWLWVKGAVERKRVYERCLVILAPREHNDVGSRGLRSQRPVVRVFAVGRFLEETHDVPGNAAEIAALVG